jgi:hypothetical protein
MLPSAPPSTIPSAAWSIRLFSRPIHTATPTAIAEVTATRTQRIESLEAWNSPREMPWFSVYHRRKKGRISTT